MSYSSYTDVANAIRSLSIDAIEKAKSGHPGAPMGMADIASQLWLDIMNYNPINPHWQNRDRFILSNGHASALLYSILHLVGYDITIEDLKNFRQLDSKTPGHPEIAYTTGVEYSSGPLGQGFATAVGFALAEKIYENIYNKESFPLVNHNTYVFLGDGCLMEGISQEALSLASTLKLGRLVALYDDNSISIDGNVEAWFNDDTPARFEANGWNVLRNIDGHNPQSIKEAFEKTVNSINCNSEKPTLLCFKTHIGYGSPHKAQSSSAHGSPLGQEEALATKKNLGIDYPEFEVPAKIYTFADRKEKGKKLEEAWNELFRKYKEKYPKLAEDFEKRVLHKNKDINIKEIEKLLLKELDFSNTALATRVSSQKVLNILIDIFPELLGGSADLSGSVGTVHKKTQAINVSKDEINYHGNYIHYGVREFGMACLMNGLALYGGFIPYGGTFLVFSDYMKGAIRLSALMRQKVIYVLTHDSIGVGEDGPTHQPIEHISSLRLIPHINVWRPADTQETAFAWLNAIERQAPTALILSRQNLPQITSEKHTSFIKKGGYILSSNTKEPELILIATGSELSLALEVYNKLVEQGKKVQLVSMPCMEVFDKQEKAYQEEVLPSFCTQRIAIEAASSSLWYKYVGLQGKVIGIDTFGESAPASKLFNHFGFSVENILKEINN